MQDMEELEVVGHTSHHHPSTVPHDVGLDSLGEEGSYYSEDSLSGNEEVAPSDQ